MEHMQPSTTWFKISESSSKKHISEIFKAPLKPSKFSFDRVSVDEQAGTSGTNVDPTGEHYGHLINHNLKCYQLLWRILTLIPQFIISFERKRSLFLTLIWLTQRLVS
jgi:hypothetical protein